MLIQKSASQRTFQPNTNTVGFTQVRTDVLPMFDRQSVQSDQRSATLCVLFFSSLTDGVHNLDCFRKSKKDEKCTWEPGVHGSKSYTFILQQVYATNLSIVFLFFIFPFNFFFFLWKSISFSFLSLQRQSSLCRLLQPNQTQSKAENIWLQLYGGGYWKQRGGGELHKSSFQWFKKDSE